MMRLLASVARTTFSRSLYARASKPPSVKVPVRRTIIGQKRGEPSRSPTVDFLMPGLMTAAVIGAIVLPMSYKRKQYLERIRPCVIEYDIMPKIDEIEAALDQSSKMAGTFEKVSFCLEPTGFNGSHILVEAFVEFELPYTSVASDWFQICNDLRLRGVHVDESEEGALVGLTEYARKYMLKGLEEHVQRKCDWCAEKKRLCPSDINRGPTKIVTTGRTRSGTDMACCGKTVKQLIAEFSNGEPSFEMKPLQLDSERRGTMKIRLQSSCRLDQPHGLWINWDYKLFCDVLKSRVIQVDRTEEGARLGLTELALKHMQTGVEEHVSR